MNKDKYEEIINGKGTYKVIAEVLFDKESCIIGWTDEIGTRFDILFTLGAIKFGNLQRGMKSNNLFVSIMDYTSYGFNTVYIKADYYIQDKLGIYGETGEKLKELINGIIKELWRY